LYRAIKEKRRFVEFGITIYEDIVDILTEEMKNETDLDKLIEQYMI
jgi:hypothetical protein